MVPLNLKHAINSLLKSYQ